MNALRSAVILLVVVVTFTGADAKAHVSNADQQQAAEELVVRLLGKKRAAQFDLRVNLQPRDSNRGPKHSVDDVFVFAASNGRVSINGSSGVAIASGMYQYLKRHCGCQVTWGVNGTGTQLSTIPSRLPDVPPTKLESVVPWRYALNMCTFGYSMPWWNWTRWEWEIDFMAMHGINLPLALTAQEYTWWKVFQKHNVTLSELQNWFTGPAFLPWGRAGNIQGYAGPLPENFLNYQGALQKKIVGRERSLGMTPVLPCFSGHLPAVAKKVWPKAKLTASPIWASFPANFTQVLLLDPTDKYYVEIGKEWMTTLLSEFGGSDHYYSCDTFNEVDPTSTSSLYLATASSAVVSGIKAGDANGVWVMQGWLFHSPFWTKTRAAAYLSGVTDNDILILDLNSEGGTVAKNFDGNYFGKFWVWDMLLNYGGLRAMNGDMSEIASKPLEDYNKKNSTMAGMGYTPEAIEQNPVMYELLTDQFWYVGDGGSPMSRADRGTVTNISSWLEDYVVQRYGGRSQKALDAWKSLRIAAYSQNGISGTGIEHVPSWNRDSSPANILNTTALMAAFADYTAAGGEVPDVNNNGPYLYDLVDLTRMATMVWWSQVHLVLNALVEETMLQPVGGNVSQFVDTFSDIGEVMMNMIFMLDKLFLTNGNFLFGRWVQDAIDMSQKDLSSTNGIVRGSSSSKELRDLFVYNAKNQVTNWAPNRGILQDYAAKAWGGLYGDYYSGRWNAWFKAMKHALKTPNHYLNGHYFRQVLFDIEEEWIKDPRTDIYPSSPIESTTTVEAAKAIYDVVFNDSALVGFELVPDATSSTVIGSQIKLRDPGQLAGLCAMYFKCRSFDSNGYLYKDSDVVSNPGITLYVRKNTKAKSQK